MPQMSPLNWLNWMLSFILMLMIFNSLNYFSFKYKFKKLNNFFYKINIKWKW